jgi:hypothetical protein
MDSQKHCQWAKEKSRNIDNKKREYSGIPRSIDPIVAMAEVTSILAILLFSLNLFVVCSLTCYSRANWHVHRLCQNSPDFHAPPAISGQRNRSLPPQRFMLPAKKE